MAVTTGPDQPNFVRDWHFINSLQLKSPVYVQATLKSEAAALTVVWIGIELEYFDQEQNI